MNLEMFSFHMNALIKHRKAGKDDQDFLQNLFTLRSYLEIPGDVYDTLVEIIMRDHKDEYNELVGAKLIKPPTHNLKEVKVQNITDGQFYVKHNDGCRGDEYRLATADDLINDKPLYKKGPTITIGEGDACRGPAVKQTYVLIAPSEASRKSSSGSCAGANAAKSNGSCEGTCRVSNTNGRC